MFLSLQVKPHPKSDQKWGTQVHADPPNGVLAQQRHVLKAGLDMEPAACFPCQCVPVCGDLSMVLKQQALQ